MIEVPRDLYRLLISIDTPTVCNAIEVVQGKRGFANFSKKTIQAAYPKAPPLVGYALTAKIKGKAKPTLSPEVVKEIRKNYYEYMSKGPRPGVCVIEDVDYPDEVGAFWGEVNTWIHKGFKLSGTVTNGVMRDLDSMASDYQVIANSIGPSHAFVHVTDVDVPVEVFGVTIKPNDFVHADRHGIVNIPREVIGNLEQGILTLLKNEKIILDVAKGKDFSYEKFVKAWEKFEKART